jgi:hypothetical protein
MLSGRENERPRAGLGTTPGAPELEAHIRQTALRASVAWDIGPIAQHGSNNLVGGWGAAVCPTATSLNTNVLMLYCPDQRLIDTLV